MKTSIKNPLILAILVAALTSVQSRHAIAQTVRTLHSFEPTSGIFPYTNRDGANPNDLIFSDNTLYGMASQGGSAGSGTVFRLNTDGTGFTDLHTFIETGGYPDYTNTDGAYPGGLILSSNTLYGTTSQGGSSGGGTVFKVEADGTGFMTLYSFTAARTTASTSTGAK